MVQGISLKVTRMEVVFRGEQSCQGLKKSRERWRKVL